jgi:lipoprotein-anchoring transpeptidase ErfK/SrfK
VASKLGKPEVFMHARTFLARTLVAVAVISAVAPFAAASSSYAAVLPLKATSAGLTFDAPTSLITSGSAVATGAVTSWVANVIATKVKRAAVDASTKLDAKHRKLVFSAARAGYKLNQAGSVTALCNALASIIATPDPLTVPLPGSSVSPSVTKYGKHILVVQSLRKFYLYNEKKVEKTYRCAVGQPSWPTPNGTFYIGRKVKNPSWTNGNASWSKNMPSYIGPGPNNPLGTRAMYVYTGKGPKGGSDTGVRFHGVPSSEDSSIGHAASHGCLRMHRKDVENFFPRVTVGVTVYIIK